MSAPRMVRITVERGREESDEYVAPEADVDTFAADNGDLRIQIAEDRTAIYARGQWSKVLTERITS